MQVLYSCSVTLKQLIATNLDNCLSPSCQAPRHLSCRCADRQFDGRQSRTKTLLQATFTHRPRQAYARMSGRLARMRGIYHLATGADLEFHFEL